MKADVKDRWLTALESGEYAQTDGRLARVDEDGAASFCCLGVLCDVIADEAGLVVRKNDNLWQIEFNGEGLVLPFEAREYTGLETGSTGVPEYNFHVIPDAETFDYNKNEPISPFDLRGNYVELHLASLNDEGFTFAQIADIIRWAEPAE